MSPVRAPRHDRDLPPFQVLGNIAKRFVDEPAKGEEPDDIHLYGDDRQVSEDRYAREAVEGTPVDKAEVPGATR